MDPTENQMSPSRLFDVLSRLLDECLEGASDYTRIAVRSLFASIDSFPLARVSWCLYPTQRSARVGLALDMIRVAIIKLHGDVGAKGRPKNSMAAEILLGDYLSSSAFKILVGLQDMEALGIVASAVTETCELQVAALACGDEAAALSERDAFLARAAGCLAGKASGQPPEKLWHYLAIGEALVGAYTAASDCSDEDSPEKFRLALAHTGQLCKLGTEVRGLILKSTDKGAHHLLVEEYRNQIRALTV